MAADEETDVAEISRQILTEFGDGHAASSSSSPAFALPPADAELAPEVPMLEQPAALGGADDPGWSFYDSAVRRPMTSKWHTVVKVQPDGTERVVGELQTVGQSRYQVVARCQWPHHVGRCSRMRAWKMTLEQPVHVER
eukprot:15479700-Alexandrium_andersonii.AAC.1